MQDNRELVERLFSKLDIAVQNPPNPLFKGGVTSLAPQTLN
jgi:hypothetical protein